MSTEKSIILDAEALLNAARFALKFSYSPYSGFDVGAAVFTESGEIISGTNIENASFGLSICAERTAIFSAIAAGHSKLLAVAITCPQALDESSRMPCGACLQVISEFADPNIPVLIDGVGEFKLNELLPIPFRLVAKKSL